MPSSLAANGSNGGEPLSASLRNLGIPWEKSGGTNNEKAIIQHCEAFTKSDGHCVFSGDDGTSVRVALPKVHNSDMLGAGILSPAGRFKGSNATVGWGLSDRFQSHPGWNRPKVNGTLVFDVMPGFKDRLQFWKRLAGSPRMFVSMNIDRIRTARRRTDAVEIPRR